MPDTTNHRFVPRAPCRGKIRAWKKTRTGHRARAEQKKNGLRSHGDHWFLLPVPFYWSRLVGYWAAGSFLRMT
jgi:hypothetical protein